MPFAALKNRFVRVVADNIDRMFLQHRLWDLRQNLVAQILYCLNVRRMTEVTDEKHALSFSERRNPSTPVFSVGNRIRQRPPDKIVYEIGFFLGNGEHRV